MVWILSGIKQGCPLVGSLLALVIDPLLWYMEHLLRFAQDSATDIFDMKSATTFDVSSILWQFLGHLLMTSALLSEMLDLYFPSYSWLSRFTKRLPDWR